MRTKAGGTFTRAGPKALKGAVFDLVGDPLRRRRLYAAVAGAAGGVFRSDDDGQHWAAQGDGTFGSGRLLARRAVNMRLAVRHRAGELSTVWVAVAGPVAARSDDDDDASGGTGGALEGLFHTTGTTRPWQSIPVATGDSPLSVNPGAQAGPISHSSPTRATGTSCTWPATTCRREAAAR